MRFNPVLQTWAKLFVRNIVLQILQSGFCVVSGFPLTSMSTTQIRIVILMAARLLLGVLATTSFLASSSCRPWRDWLVCFVVAVSCTRSQSFWHQSSKRSEKEGRTWKPASNTAKDCTNGKQHPPLRRNKTRLLFLSSGLCRVRLLVHP